MAVAARELMPIEGRKFVTEQKNTFSAYYAWYKNTQKNPAQYSQSIFEAVEQVDHGLMFQKFWSRTRGVQSASWPRCGF